MWPRPDCRDEVDDLHRVLRHALARRSSGGCGARPRRRCFQSIWRRPEPPSPNEFRRTLQSYDPTDAGSVVFFEISSASTEQWVRRYVDLGTRSAAVKPQMEVYRSKAKEYARLTVLTKLPRESRRYRKLAEMYWALALSEEPENAQPLKMIVKTSPT
jgi:hypothetical protein